VNKGAKAPLGAGAEAASTRGVPAAAPGALPDAPPQPPVPGRPFTLGTWLLPAGRLSLPALGWQPDADAPGGAAAAAGGAATPAPGPVAAKPGSGGGARAKGGTAAPSGPAAAGQQAQAQQQRQEQQGTAAQGPQAAAATAAEDCEVSGVDTPCHRAAVRAYCAALASAERALSEAAAAHGARVAAWREHERRWAAAWGRMLDGLDTV
jgi:hypothetical protein